VNKLITVLF